MIRVDTALFATAQAGDPVALERLLRELQPTGAVPPFDAKALADTANALLAQPPSPPVTIRHTLRAMQEATLAVYAELDAD